jgi:ribosomal protein S12 methylthiotransferase accessory factor
MPCVRLAPFTPALSHGEGEDRGEGDRGSAIEHSLTAKGWRLGTHRAVPPSETVARLRPLMPALGITRLADVTGLDRIGVPVFQAIRPLSRSVSVSQGKGLDADAARASALMEAAETWHAERAETPLRLARERDLRERASPSWTRAPCPRVAGGAYGPGVADPLGRGEGARQRRPVWVPYELVHADYTLPQPAGSGHFLASTNGSPRATRPTRRSATACAS